MEFFDQNGKVVCQVCKQAFTMISTTHLMKKHNMTTSEYKDKFPGAPLNGSAFGKTVKFSKTSPFKKDQNSPKTKPISDDVIREIELSPVFDPTTAPITEVLKYFEPPKPVSKPKKVVYPDPSNSIHPEKHEILNYLLNIFPTVTNNYSYEGKTVAGHVEFILITDISIPERKIDIEFPNSFWHNEDRPKGVRDPILKKEGWKIIDILHTNPTIFEVKEALEFAKLI